MIQTSNTTHSRIATGGRVHFVAISYYNNSTCTTAPSTHVQKERSSPQSSDRPREEIGAAEVFDLTERFGPLRLRQAARGIEWTGLQNPASQGAPR